MPNQPKTPMHSFRCPDELWEDAKRVAADREETVAEVLRKALKRYVKRPSPFVVLTEDALNDSMRDDDERGARR